MAKLNLCVSWEDVALVAGSWKTVAGIQAGTDQVVSLKRVRLATSGVAGGAKPLEFRLHRITAASGTGTAFTPVTVNESNTTTKRSTCRVNFSAEPTLTANKYLFQDKFHPQGGLAHEYSFSDVEIAAAAETVIQVKLPSAETVVNCSGHAVYEE